MVVLMLFELLCVYYVKSNRITILWLEHLGTNQHNFSVKNLPKFKNSQVLQKESNYSNNHLEQNEQT